MFKKVKITEDDANTLNFGIPLVLTLFFFIVNGMIFSAFYAESMLEVFKIYLFFIFIVLAFDFFKAKSNKETKTIIGLNAYKNLVLSSVFVLLFLGLNFINSKTIFETNIACNNRYSQELRKYQIPASFNKFYIVDEEETRNYFNGKYYLKVKVAESVFGYKILEQRSFEQLTKN